MARERAKQKAVRPARTPAAKPSVATAEPAQPSRRAGNALDAIAGSAATVPAEVIDALATEHGMPLPQAELWSRRIGADVSGARLVVGVAAAAAALAVRARAFTVGNRVFFAAGNDASTDGGGLLAHELVHVAQQRGASEPEAWDEMSFVGAGDARERAAQVGDASHASAMAIARYADTEPVDAATYFDSMPMWEVLEQLFGNIQDPKLEITQSDAIGRGPFGKYLTYDEYFRNELKKTWFRSGWTYAELAGLLVPDSLKAIIDRSRALDWEQPDPDKEPVKTDKGPKHASEYETAIEVANVLVRHYFDSMARMFPRVAATVVKKNPVIEQGSTAPFVTTAAAEVVVSHPMDVEVRDRLLAVQDLLQRQFLAAVSIGDVPYDLEIPQSTAAPTLAFLPRDRLWHWVKATPETSSREQVATVLFGAPEQAFRLIAMKPLWGFRARDVAAFTDENLTALEQHTRARFNDPTPSLRPPDDLKNAVVQLLWPEDPDLDPLLEFSNTLGERGAEERNAATKTATAPAPGDKAVSEAHDEMNVFDIERSMVETLDDLAKIAPVFKLEPDAIDTARARFAVRRDAMLIHCPRDVESMYAFADEQRGLLVRVALGMGDAFSRLSGGQVTADSPLREMAAAYLAALAAIELPDYARSRLDEADVLMRHIDIALQEEALHERLGELHAEYTESFSSKPDPLVKPFDHSKLLDKQLELLADARIAMQSDPIGAQKNVLALKPQVDQLGFEIGLSEKLARLNMLWSLIDGEDDIWEDGLETAVGNLLKRQNRALYWQFYNRVFLPFLLAAATNDDKLKKQARDEYASILTGPDMKAHADTVKQFLEQVAKHKKWTKLIVGLAIAFVAFGLGQWEFGAVLAGGGTVFEAAVAAGLVTTATSVVLNKVILNQNPTVIGVLTGFFANFGTFFVIGKLALAAKAAGTEAALAESATAATANTAASATKTAGLTVKSVVTAGGKLAWQLTYQSVIAAAIGTAQAEIETLAEKHRTLTFAEAEDVWVQSVISTVAMHVFAVVTPKDLFQYKTPEQRLANELTALNGERELILKRALEIQKAASLENVREGQPLPKPDKAGVMELLDKWKTYLEREQAVREKLLDYAEKHPGKFTEAEIAALKSNVPDPTLTRQIREAKATLAIEVDGINKYSCAAGALDTVIAQHQAVGNEITRIETDEQTGQRTITIKPTDGSPPFRVTEKIPPKGQRTAAKVPVESARHFEQWLDGRDRPQSSIVGQAELRAMYARDPAAAMNLASEKYGYEPTAQSIQSRALVVHPDAPGAVEPLDPFVSPVEHATAVGLGHGVIAIGSGRFLAAPTELAGMHKTWAAKEGAKPTEIRYDPETNTSHFEMEIDGRRVRVEATLAPRAESFPDAVNGRNLVVGGKISQGMGEAIMQGIANGQPEMLKATGVTGDVVAPGVTLEFGLGKIDGGYVIVVGEPNAVDWAALPGIEPVGHTHPLHAGNDLPMNMQGERTMTVPELLAPKPDSLIARDLVFPSAQDFVVMAIRRIVGHKVYTGFVVENGVIRKPVAGESLPGIEFTIGETVLAGKNAKGQRVFESTIEGKAGIETPVSKRKIWIVEDHAGGPGGLFMTEPEGLVSVAGDDALAGGSATKGGLSPAMRKLAKAYGDDVVHWAMEAGDEDQAGALAKLAKPLRTELMKIPAGDARDLLRDSTQTRIQRALKSGLVSAADLLELRTRLGTEELNARLDAAGTDAASLQKLAQRAAIERKAILNQPLNEAKLNELGYRVDKNNVIYRPEGAGGTMEPLKVRDDKVVIGDAESASEVQARVFAKLPGPKQAQFAAMQKAAPKGTKVRLVEGIFDTGATWQDVFGSGKVGTQRRAALKKILTDPKAKKGAGMTGAKADALIDGLLNRTSTIKVVLGTDPVRTAYDYREGNATGADEAHHFDPLYLGGGHELIAALPEGAHDAVHAFFDNLEFPSTSKIAEPVRGSPLQANKLQAKVRAKAEPAVVIVDGTTVTFKPLGEAWKL